MTRQQMIDAINARCGFNTEERHTAMVMRAFEDWASSELREGRQVPIPGIGIIGLRFADARSGRNPRTGEPMKIPAQRRVVFRASRAIKRAVNGR